MASPVPVPVGTPVKRTLHFFWLTDYSGSMSGTKIAILNQAIREALPELRQAVTAHPEVQITMRAIKFADSASWHVGPTAVPLEQFVWPELRTAGTTATAQAIRMLGAELTAENMPRRGYRGGSWYHVAGNCRMSYRGSNVPGNRNAYLGFRLLRTAQ